MTRAALLREWTAAGHIRTVRRSDRHDLYEVRGLLVAVPRHRKLCGGLVAWLRSRVAD